MIKHIRFFNLLLVGLLVSLAACSSEKVTRDTERPRRAPRLYDSAFPDRNISPDVQRIFQSVKRIQSTIFYETHIIKPGRMLRGSEVNKVDLDSYTIRKARINQSTAGTAVVLTHRRNRAVLLTCAHTVTFPDTLVKFRSESYLPRHTYVESISIKKDQQNTIFNLPYLSRFDLLAKDDDSDIALLGISTKPDQRESLTELQVPAGQPRNLGWGSFVYVLGYPKGYQMITRAIVSDPGRGRFNNFLLDALFNKGFSGGLVLAIHGGVPNFEWVGMANSASAHKEDVLAPQPDKAGKYDPYTPYHDSIYVESRTRIDYGITQAVSVDEIRSFVREHQREIERKGYYLNDVPSLLSQK